MTDGHWRVRRSASLQLNPRRGGPLAKVWRIRLEQRSVRDDRPVIPAQPAPPLASGSREARNPPQTAAVHAIPTPLGAVEAGNQEPSPAAARAYAYDDPPPGPVTDPPPPADHYDLIAATDEERRAADELARQLHDGDAEILATAQSGELAQKDVKPALERRMQTETERLRQIFGADRTAKLLEARSRPGG